MAITLISPRLVVKKGDWLGSGVPYWPLEMAILASFLLQRGEIVHVIDCFGDGPEILSERADHYLQGRSIQAYAHTSLLTEASLFVVFAISYLSHAELIEVIRFLQSNYPDTPILVQENTYAVTGYDLSALASGLLKAGASGIVCGEPYENWEELRGGVWRKGTTEPPLNCISLNSSWRAVERMIGNSSCYPVPAWELFPYQSYWQLPYAHGPKVGPYFPILTSRGCPGCCDFCTAPTVASRRWRPRSAEDVAREMLSLQQHFGASHFQIEDLNPTVDFSRWQNLGSFLQQSGTTITYAFASGTKSETIAVEDVPFLAQSGCRYLSISPESGSPELLSAMGKSFNHAHGVALVAACSEHRIATQACFLVGHPAETSESVQQSLSYLQQLLNAGLSEVAVFAIAPITGSALQARNTVAAFEAGRLVSFGPADRKQAGVLRQIRNRYVGLFFRHRLWEYQNLPGLAWHLFCGLPRTKLDNLSRKFRYLLSAIIRLRLAGDIAKESITSIVPSRLSTRILLITWILFTTILSWVLQGGFFRQSLGKPLTEWVDRLSAAVLLLLTP